MKSSEIQVGGTYTASVAGKSQLVRIERKLPRGGWEALSLASNKKVRIKTPQQVLRAAEVPAEAAAVGEAMEPAPSLSPPQAPVQGEAAAGEATAAEPVEDAASAAPKGKKGSARPSRRAAKANATGPAKRSCLDAAAEVLRDSGQPMQCKQMIDAMFKAQLWHSDAPTPAATLHSALQREITTKGTAARFRKTDRGHFALNT